MQTLAALRMISVTHGARSRVVRADGYAMHEAASSLHTAGMSEAINAGNGVLAALVEWTAQLVHFMLQPISGASDHHLAAWASWHGRAMVLAWESCCPWGYWS